MNRTVLLASTALLALATAGTATEGKPSPTFFITQSLRVLWNQNSNDSGNSVNSQVLTSNYTSTSAFSAADDFVIPKSSTSNFSYSDEAADDFVVPRGKTWRIKEVDVTGIYYNGSGKVAGHAPFLQNVIFYKNRRGMPGKRLRGFRYRDGGAGPNFTIPLPGTGIKLRAGHSWVSVTANVKYPAADWGWEDKRHPAGKSGHVAVTEGLR